MMPPDALPGVALLDVANAARSDPWPAAVRASELCAHPPAVPAELIHGVMYRGGTMMLSGASKSRKTYTMLAAGNAIASGSDWLGFATTATPVLYLNLELQEFAVAQRLQAIARGMGVPVSADLHVVNLRGVMVSIDNLETHLEKLLAETAAGLVIVDPHYKLSSASRVEENSNDGQALLLYRIERAICRSGAAVMLAHHFSKGDASTKKAIDRSSGGGALARWPDVVMSMTEHEEEGCITAEFALRNFAPIEPFVLRWRGSVWARDTALDPAALKRPGRTDAHPPEELLRRLVDGMTNKEWRTASGWSDSTFRAKRDQLQMRGLVGGRAGCWYHVPQESQESQEVFPAVPAAAPAASAGIVYSCAARGALNPQSNLAL